MRSDTERLRRLTAAFAFFAWLTVAALVLVVLTTTRHADEAAREARRLAVVNECQDEALARIDTAWRRALNQAIAAYIAGQTGVAVDALPGLRAAAQVDIVREVTRGCGR